MWKADNGGFVEVIQQLAEESVPRKRDGGKMTPVNQRINNLRHVILCRFNRQEARLLKRMHKKLMAGYEWPKKGDHPPDNTAHCLDAYALG